MAKLLENTQGEQKASNDEAATAVGTRTPSGDEAKMLQFDGLKATEGTEAVSRNRATELSKQFLD